MCLQLVGTAGAEIPIMKPGSLEQLLLQSYFYSIHDANDALAPGVPPVNLPIHAAGQ